MTKDREYYQELAYLEAEKEFQERKELEEYDQYTQKPAKILIQKHGERAITKFGVNPVPL